MTLPPDSRPRSGFASLPSSGWEATRVQTQIATRFLGAAGEAPEERDIGRPVDERTRELFVAVDPAEALVQQFDHIKPEYVAVHALGTSASRKLIGGLAAASQRAPVVETEFGYHVLKVTDQRAASSTAFEEVQAGIRRQLEARKQQEAVETEAKRLRAAIADLSQLDAVAAKEGLKVEERVVTRDDPARDLGPSPEFVNGIFSTAPGSVAAPAAIARGMAIAGIVEAVPSTVRPYEEVAAQAKSEAHAERQRQAALAAARRAAGDLDAAARGLQLLPGYPDRRS